MAGLRSVRGAGATHGVTLMLLTSLSASVRSDGDTRGLPGAVGALPQQVLAGGASWPWARRTGPAALPQDNIQLVHSLLLENVGANPGHHIDWDRNELNTEYTNLLRKTGEFELKHEELVKAISQKAQSLQELKKRVREKEKLINGLHAETGVLTKRLETFQGGYQVTAQSAQNTLSLNTVAAEPGKS
mmetsp:Transcript_16230/g.47400  ORF Transcript_16230/g.47400 Transcript_16230/m.47400 type:complete len:188 (-) Transcript_16230:31-594(-)|eukprot:CAMPEP_0168390904 /NCGR_PEP_ID=MMETSP0228-20121227/17713_1 /TAXON_ID=133427 /ORGANISM="Protoceratium reticulatum, Strain CCCM 535 (=CCMP 1889)" /LENGTH=187 /DNA_ID=CAMNT_0008404209 /DNA_START=83 /DNA_END=646 /DNA_ORIENTATION=-